MASHLRRFQEEREAIEKEVAVLEKKNKQEVSQREEAERQLNELWEEVEWYRAQPDPSQTIPAPPQVDAEAMERARRAHHEKQLALMATIDAMRKEMLQEQERSRALEKRAAQAELRSRQTSVEELDGTTRVPLRRAGSGATDASVDSLGNTSRVSDPRRREEVRALEDEALKLREELNAEKSKVVELKKAALQRGAAWKEQLQRITEEVGAKQRLEEENAQLRVANATLRRDMAQWQEREGGLRKQATQLQREAADAMAAGKDARSEAAGKVEEMELLSSVVGDQLVAVEQELTQQVQKSNQLFELFLRHSLQPLSTVRRCCRQLAPELTPTPANRELGVRAVPPMCEANVHDLKNNLVKLVNLLRYCADVLDAHDAWRQTQRKGSSGSASLDETGKGLSWLQGVLA